MEQCCVLCLSFRNSSVQACRCTTSASSTNKLALCLVRWSVRVRRCAHGVSHVLLGTKISKLQNSLFLSWNGHRTHRSRRLCCAVVGHSMRPLLWALLLSRLSCLLAYAQKVKCAREALRSWRVSRPPGHEDVKAAKERVLELERALG